MKKVLCAVNSAHVVELGEKDWPFMVGLAARQNADSKIRALAGKIVCRECGRKIDADIFLAKKCDAPDCEEWTVVTFCDEHHRQHQEVLELKRLERKVVVARLEFVAAIKLQAPKGVLAKIYGDAKAAEEAKHFVDALRYYRQALSVWESWQTPNHQPAKPKKQKVARVYAFRRQPNDLTPAPAPIVIEPTTVEKVVTEDEALAAFDAYKKYEKGAESINEKCIELDYAANAAYLLEYFETAKTLWEKAFEELKAHNFAVLSLRMANEVVAA